MLREDVGVGICCDEVEASEDKATTPEDPLLDGREFGEGEARR